ncbi:MAG: hypothetical protein IT453_20805 [Planctomycetes bacterium]|nr:hypothetical protein [Planctomycetota bacterium]
MASEPMADFDDMTAQWNELRTSSDAGDLMRRFGEFHDGCIHEMHVWTGDYVSERHGMGFGRRTTVRVLVQRQRSPLSAIELLFVGVRRFQLVPPKPDCVGLIFEATLRPLDGGWLWRPDPGGEHGELVESESTFVSARRLFWRDASEWMGETSRYGPDQPALDAP